jgi:hypothetical protein
VDQGFYVEVEEKKKYEGPFVSLNQAREEARKIGPDLKILHGVLEKNEDGSYDTSNIFLVPKVKK